MHKVDLTTPDKVILVEIYTVCLLCPLLLSRWRSAFRMLTHNLQAVCGISVVGGDWESHKRYNLAELYSKPVNRTSVLPEASAQSVTKDETGVESTSHS